MKKVAIVGVEGSGKTVMLAGLGELYTHPDAKGYFLSPKNRATADYVTDKIRRMRQGEWPAATAGDVMQGLDWTLERKRQGQRAAVVCAVSFLDFPGEVYREAFGGRAKAGDAELAREAESLRQHVRVADELIVLVNLHDVITRSRGDPRVDESIWITKAILDFALAESDAKKKRAAIVVSQSDSYMATIQKFGGPRGVLNEYLPHVANRYDWLDIFDVSAVDKIIVDDSGQSVPAPDFQPIGLRPILNWIMGDAEPKVVSAAVAKKDENDCKGEVPFRSLSELLEDSFVKIPNERFYMGKTPVTQALWKSVMGMNPSHFTGEDRPVEMVSMPDCLEFIKRLNARREVIGKKLRFRLPTRSEWLRMAEPLSKNGDALVPTPEIA